MLIAAALVVLICVAAAAAWWFLSPSKAPSASVSVKLAPQSATAPAAAAALKHEEEDVSKPQLLIFFASQTGTAENFAKGLVAEGKKRGFRPKSVDLQNSVQEALVAGGLCIFLVATYGEGDPTDNAREFVAWLKLQPATSDLLTRLRFAVFGLGNRQYEHFNSQGKLFDERLAALGGDRLLPIGLGDDDGTMEDDYASWKDRLWPALAAAAGGSAAASTAAAAAATAGDAETDAPTLAWSVVPVPAPTGAPTPAAVNAAAADLGSRHFYIAHTARVTACRELRRGPVEPGDSTRHIELDIGGAPYATADNLYVLPENDAATVKAVARWLGFDLDMWFTLEAADKQAPPAAPPFPVPCSVRDALTHYCDLHGAPRKELVAELAPFAASADERAAMRALAHRDGKARWAELVSGPQRSVVELLQLFPSLRLPLGAFVELAPRLMPRAYTIASSALVHPASVHVCSRVVDTPKPGGDASRRLRGVCSTFLARAQPGATMRVYVRPSTFRLPADVSVPIILVGPGTGIAPMRAFLQERSLQRSRGEAIGEIVLFFGCQRRAHDFIYEDELAAFVADGTLTSLEVAYSRDGPDKVYVQHLIGRSAGRVWGLLNRGAHLYVCGATSMGHDVHAAIEAVHRSEGGLDAAAAAAAVKVLQAQKRYVAELW